MADSPLLNADGPVRLSVFSNGTALPDGARLLSVRVDRGINQVPTAHLALLDGDPVTEAFSLSESDIFKPGAEIRINGGYGDTEATLFEGIVVKHALRIDGNNDARLVVDCCDKVVRMTVGRHSANHIAQTDSEVITQLLARHGLATNGVQATTAQHPALVQYLCSDWDFLLARAEANGLLVIATDGQLTVKEPATSGASTLCVTHGQDLISFQAELNALTQFSNAQAASWDIASQAVITSTDAPPPQLNAQGNLDSATLAQVAGAEGMQLQSGASIGPAALGQWAQAQQLKAGLARIRGQMRFQGSAKAQVGGLITLKGTGARFDGEVLVSGLTHEISDGNWTTEVQFGLSPQWATSGPGVTAPRAAGLVPAVEGLQIGVVTRLEGDPEGQHRVQVSVPVMQDGGQGVWARLAQLQGSGGFGTFFVPEVGDEVVLGFFNHDPSHPVILGSLHSSQRPPPYALTDANPTRAIVSRCKARIEFDDAQQRISITTPGRNTMVLSDADRSIMLSDPHGNQLSLHANGITLSSPKDLVLRATGQIKLDAVGAIGIAAQGDVTTQGLNVRSQAQVALTAQGAASAELSATGQTVVKGAMVMIN